MDCAAFRYTPRMTESQDLQTTFLNRLRRDNVRVAVWLVSGKRLVGRIKGYDRFTVLLEGGGSDQLIFKHGIASVSVARENSRPSAPPE